VPVEGQFVGVAATQPEDVVAYARKCAQAIKPIIDAEPRRLVINKKRYLYFESWQTIGWFYGVTAQVVDTYELDTEGRFRGYGARANAIRGGATIATAYSECSIDEANWRGRERNAVLSMAQTRAMGKALRSCLAWVAVLGGYGATTAEEMEGMDKPEAARARPAPAPARGKAKGEAKPEPEEPPVEPPTDAPSDAKPARAHRREPGSLSTEQKTIINQLLAVEKTKGSIQSFVKQQGWTIQKSAELSEYQAAVILHVLDGGAAEDIA